MKFRMIIVRSGYIVASSVILLCLLVFGFFSSQDRPVQLTLVCSEDAKTQIIKSWTDESGKIFFFLPAYANPERTNFRTESAERGIYIGGERILSETPLACFELNREYDLQVDGKDYKIEFVKSANLPALSIDTHSGKMDYIHRNKKKQEKINACLYGADGQIWYCMTQYADEIRGHGNSTWSMEKKPYNLYLSAPQSFFGSKPGKNWVLLANASDASKIRSHLCHSLADAAADVWNPTGGYVDLYLNGNYAGQYYLIEKVEASENKVQLADGELLLNLELTGRADNYRLDELFPGVSAEICAPDNLQWREITEKRNALKEIIDTVKSGEATDEYLRTHVDLQSWAWKYVLDELSQNYDSAAASLYFTFDGNRIKSQAAWDYDNTLGMELHRSPASFLANRFWKDEIVEASWYHALLQYDIFRMLVREEFEQRYLPELHKQLSGGLQATCQSIRESARMDQIRWPSSYADTEFSEACWQVYEYLKKRGDFLSSAWLENVQYHTICLKGASQYLYFSVRDNAAFEELPDGKELIINDFSAWVDEQTGQVFDTSQPITCDKVLIAQLETTNEYGNTANVWKNEMQSGWHLSLGDLRRLLLAALCMTLVISGGILIYLDVKRRAKGEENAKTSIPS